MIIRVRINEPWKMYVHVPNDRTGKTSENAYGTLEMAEMPEPEYSIRTTPKLFMTITSRRAYSPLSTFLSPSTICPSAVCPS